MVEHYVRSDFAHRSQYRLFTAWMLLLFVSFRNITVHTHTHTRTRALPDFDLNDEAKKTHLSLIHMHSNFNPTPKVKSINQSFVILFLLSHLLIRFLFCICACRCGVQFVLNDRPQQQFISGDVCVYCYCC